jgi:hypothetical protein
VLDPQRAILERSRLRHTFPRRNLAPAPLRRARRTGISPTATLTLSMCSAMVLGHALPRRLIWPWTAILTPPTRSRQIQPPPSLSPLTPGRPVHLRAPPRSPEPSTPSRPLLGARNRLNFSRYPLRPRIPLLISSRATPTPRSHPARLRWVAQIPARYAPPYLPPRLRPRPASRTVTRTHRLRSTDRSRRLHQPPRHRPTPLPMGPSVFLDCGVTAWCLVDLCRDRAVTTWRQILLACRVTT